MVKPDINNKDELVMWYCRIPKWLRYELNVMAAKKGKKVQPMVQEILAEALADFKKEE